MREAHGSGYRFIFGSVRTQMAVTCVESRVRHQAQPVGTNSNIHSRLIFRKLLSGLVGTGRFELPTCRLGGDRSIHLSYVPATGKYNNATDAAKAQIKYKQRAFV